MTAKYPFKKEQEIFGLLDNFDIHKARAEESWVGLDEMVTSFDYKCTNKRLAKIINDYAMSEQYGIRCREFLESVVKDITEKVHKK